MAPVVPGSAQQWLGKNGQDDQRAYQPYVPGPDFPEQGVLHVRATLAQFLQYLVAVPDPADVNTEHEAQQGLTVAGGGGNHQAEQTLEIEQDHRACDGDQAADHHRPCG